MKIRRHLRDSRVESLWPGKNLETSLEVVFVFLSTKKTPGFYYNSKLFKIRTERMLLLITTFYLPFSVFLYI
jgi:hypothetical protein